MSKKQLLILLFAVVVTRLPFLWLGYGSDADAWRVAHSASELWHTGVYEPSRLPGYPLHEYLSAPLVAFGRAPLSNTGSLVACLLLLLVWNPLCKREGNHPALLMLTLAFTPLVWKNSTTTMDYLWSLSAILIAFTAALDGRSVRSGVWLGIAIGFRPTNAVAVLPMIAVLMHKGVSKKEIVGLCVATVLTGALAFLPLLLRYGLTGWVSATQASTVVLDYSLTERVLYFGYRTLSSFGIPATVAAMIILALRWRQLRSSFQTKNPVVVGSLVGVVSFLGLYWFYPLEREYLLPAFPFAILILDRIASMRAFMCFAICLIAFAFVNPDVIKHHGVKGTPEFNIREGIVLEDWVRRQDLLRVREEIGQLALPGKSVVLTGGDRQYWFENPALERDSSAFWRSFREISAHQKGNPETHFMQVIDSVELKLVRSAGYTPYYLVVNEEYIEKIAGFSLEEEGIRPVKAD